MRRKDRPPRWFLGLVEIGGILGGLRSGLRECGVVAELHLLRPHPFAYTQDDDALIPNLAKRAVARRGGDRRRLQRGLWKAVELLTRATFFAWAIVRYDVFVFTFGTTFFDGHDLRLLRALHKRTVLVFVGSDERPPYLNGVHLMRDGGVSAEEVNSLTRTVHRRVRTADRFGDLIVGHPLSAQFHRRPMVALTHMGFPMPFRQRPAQDYVEKVRVVHAPSNPTAKGSKLIRTAIQELIAEGLSIDYVEISGVTNDEVIELLGRSDLLVDDAWSDSPMSVLTAEAASVGTPAVTGGYGWQMLDSAYLEPPVARVHPDELKHEIRRMVLDGDARSDLGCRARAFVRAQWAQARVAQRYLDLVSGTIDPALTFDPACITYTGGCGAPVEVIREAVAALVGARGVAALLLDDKPALKAALCAHV